MTSVNRVPKDMPRHVGYNKCVSYMMCVFLLHNCDTTYNKTLLRGPSIHKHGEARHVATNLEEHNLEHDVHVHSVMDAGTIDMSPAIGCDACASCWRYVLLLLNWNIASNKTVPALRSTHKHAKARHSVSNLMESQISTSLDQCADEHALSELGSTGKHAEARNVVTHLVAYQACSPLQQRAYQHGHWRWDGSHQVWHSWASSSSANNAEHLLWFKRIGLPIVDTHPMCTTFCLHGNLVLQRATMMPLLACK